MFEWIVEHFTMEDQSSQPQSQLFSGQYQEIIRGKELNGSG